MAENVRFRFNDLPPAPKKWAFWRVAPIPPAGVVQYRPLVEVVPMLQTHFVQTTKVCLKEGCSHCAAGIPARWTAFMPAFDVKAKVSMVAMFPADYLADLYLMVKEGTSLRDYQVTMSRRSTTSNGPVSIRSVVPVSEIVDSGQWRYMKTGIEGSMESVLRAIGLDSKDIPDTASHIYLSMTNQEAQEKARLESLEFANGGKRQVLMTDAAKRKAHNPNPPSPETGK